jgi:hypothetical protein
MCRCSDRGAWVRTSGFSASWASVAVHGAERKKLGRGTGGNRPRQQAAALPDARARRAAEERVGGAGVAGGVLGGLGRAQRPGRLRSGLRGVGQGKRARLRGLGGWAHAGQLGTRGQRLDRAGLAAGRDADALGRARWAGHVVWAARDKRARGKRERAARRSWAAGGRPGGKARWAAGSSSGPRAGQGRGRAREVGRRGEGRDGPFSFSLLFSLYSLLSTTSN